MRRNNLMTRPKTTDDKEKTTVGITVRIDKNENRILSAILALKGMTLSGFLQSSIKNFISENYGEARDLFNSLEPHQSKDSK